MATLCREQRWIGTLASGVALFLAGCGQINLPEPTLIVSPTGPPTVATRTAIPSVTPTLTAPPSDTPRPPVTLPPTRTSPPASATPDIAARTPFSVATQPQGFRLTISEAQLNAALARRFDAAPLPDHGSAPRAALGFGFVTLGMHIFAADAPPGADALPVTLMLQLDHPGGLLETFPTQMVPLHAGVTTRQAKPGEELLLQALLDLIHAAAGDRLAFVESALIRPEGIALDIITAGG